MLWLVRTGSSAEVVEHHALLRARAGADDQDRRHCVQLVQCWSGVPFSHEEQCRFVHHKRIRAFVSLLFEEQRPRKRQVAVFARQCYERALDHAPAHVTGGDRSAADLGEDALDEQQLVPATDIVRVRIQSALSLGELVFRGF